MLLSVSGAAVAGVGRRDGWKGICTVAQLQQELGVGAPRDTNFLYKPIEWAGATDQAARGGRRLFGRQAFNNISAGFDFLLA